MNMKLLPKLYIFLLIVLVAGCVATNKNHYQAIPKLQWELDIDGPIQQLEKVYEDLYQQGPMNRTAWNIAYLYDIKLYISFHDYLSMLSVDQRSIAIKEQNAWLENRKKIPEEEEEGEGGSIRPLVIAQDTIAFTKERIEAIQEEIRNISGKTTQPAR